MDGPTKRTSRDSEKLINTPDHEYHEISDEDDFGFIENSKFEVITWSIFNYYCNYCFVVNGVGKETFQVYFDT